MGIWRHILEGFGWGVGRDLAKKAVDEVGDRIYDEADQARERIEEAREAHARQKEEKKRRKAEARAERERERQIDAELAELKRRVGDE